MCAHMCGEQIITAMAYLHFGLMQLAFRGKPQEQCSSEEIKIVTGPNGVGAHCELYHATGG